MCVLHYGMCLKATRECFFHFGLQATEVLVTVFLHSLIVFLHSLEGILSLNS